MKKLFSFGLIAAAVMMLSAQVSSAQPQKKGSGPREGNPQEWYQKMKQARIAFFTTECKFTEDEAKAFWPVYDQIEEERREATKATMEAYKELMEAVKAGKSDSEVEKLLKKYTDASAKTISQDEIVARYKKILPAAKVARVILAEEKFRQQQIHRLHGENGEGGPRPGGGQGGFGGGDRGGNFGGGRPGGNRDGFGGGNRPDGGFGGGLEF